MPRLMLPLALLLAVGCAQGSLERRLRAEDRAAVEVVPTDGPARPPGAPVTPASHLSLSPGTEETAKRVASVGQKVLEANPQAGVRPLFSTVGAGHVEAFHRSANTGQFQGSQVFVSEGLARKCQRDDQLAAVLAFQLANLVSEREALVSPSVRQADRRAPAEVRVGNDAGGSFGSPDGTRLVELAKVDRDRRRPTDPALPPPDPAVLARQYLQRAGFDPAVLGEVMPLLRQAEEADTLSRQMPR